MKSAVFYGVRDLRVEESPKPKVGSKEVLIRVKACGVCGTDIHIYEGDKGAAAVTPPTIMNFPVLWKKSGKKSQPVKSETVSVLIQTAIAETAFPAGKGQRITANT